MNGRRAVVGLSLLSALVFCAFAAPSAQALKGTTVFTCVKDPEGTLKGEHCLKEGIGNFSHKEIPINTTTAVEGSNAQTKNETKESTDARLKGTIAGASVTITAKTVASEGSLENVTQASGQMTVQGNTTINYTGLSTTAKNCTVTEPIVATANVMSQVNEAGEMWMEFEGNKEITVKQEFASVQFTGEKCAIKGTFPVSGIQIGTPEAGTLHFPEKEAKNALKFGGGVAEYIGTETVRMKKAGQTLEPAISITTQEK